MAKQRFLDALYRKHAKMLYFYLYNMCGSEALAEDLVQETFLRATIALHTYESEHAKAWLLRVARNIYLDEWRKQQRRRNNPIYQRWLKPKDMICPYGVPEEEYKNKEQMYSIQNILVALPEKYRTIIYLREYEQFSYEEIGQAMHLTLTQVKTTLFRARQKIALLRERMED